jgi:PPM family protein phosphatase
MMKVFTYSGKGKRVTNEDYILIKSLSETNSIYLLADGMGGYLHGDIASSLACNSISEYLSANLDKDDIPGSISQSVESANSAIRLQRDFLKTKLGATIAGALVNNDTAYLFWVGDVRIYHFRGDNILFQSEDHSLLNEMRKNGTISTTDLTRYRNIVTRSLMGESYQNQMPLKVVQVCPGDTLIICSDGLWQNWNPSTILNIPETELLNLLSANESNNDDNYTIIKILF